MNRNQQELQKMKEVIDSQEQIIEMLSNEEAVKGLNSALDDVKNGRYIVLTN